MTNQDAAVAAARDHRAANGVAIVGEFLDLLRLPNVSHNLDDVAAVARHVVTMLAGRGVNARTIERPEAGPLVVGHYRRAEAAPTIGIYAHFDGQPVDQPDWQLDPFSPTLLTAPLDAGGVPAPPLGDLEAIDSEWRLYARSAADDKAPILAACAALDALHSADLSPHVNLVFLFEGEEERGSPHLADYMSDLLDELSTADVWLICDGPVHQTRRPQIVFGVRGISELEITSYGPLRPLHSGHYGNWARNPNLELARLLASMKDDDGNVSIPGFYEGTQAITSADEAAMAALPDDDQALRAELGLGDTEGAGSSLARRLLLPSLNIRGWQGGGVGDEAANVIPTSATASLDVRLAPGNDPEQILESIVAFMRHSGWHVVATEPSPEVRRTHRLVARVRRHASYPGVRLPTDSPLAEALLATAAVAADQPVVAVPTFGGSVPLHHFTTLLGAPIAITPFANHDNNQHAANENIRIGNLWYGIDLMAALMTMDLPSTDFRAGRL